MELKITISPKDIKFLRSLLNKDETGIIEHIVTLYNEALEELR